MKKIAIIGGGASGLVAAYYASENEDHSVTVFEKNEIVGKKLRITGNGRCNYSNEDLSISHYEHSFGMSEPDFFDSMALEDNLKLIQNVIGEDGTEEFTKFLEKCGILSCNHKGCLYPYSERAKDLTEIIYNVLCRKGVVFKFNSDIKEIAKNEDGSFQITGENFDRVILCCGGKAAPKTGSDGGGFKLARAFGHTTSYTYPVLVPLTIDDAIGSKLAGIRVKGKVTAIVDKSVVSSVEGEIQFTDHTISGIPTFQLSRRLTKPLEEKSDCIISCDFLPFLKIENIASFVNARIANLGNLEPLELFRGILPDQIYEYLYQAFLKVDYHETYDSDSASVRFLKYLKDYRLQILGHGGYNDAQCTRGGVLLTEITDTLESRFVPGLFFAGEMLDVDGDCGGYNLQWAFSSGKISGENV